MIFQILLTSYKIISILIRIYILSCNENLSLLLASDLPLKNFFYYLLFGHNKN